MRRGGFGGLQVQQLVLAAAAAVRKELLLVANVGLSQRCDGEFFTRFCAATGVQCTWCVVLKQLAAAALVLVRCHPAARA